MKEILKNIYITNLRIKYLFNTIKKFRKNTIKKCRNEMSANLKLITWINKVNNQYYLMTEINLPLTISGGSRPHRYIVRI